MKSWELNDGRKRRSSCEDLGRGKLEISSLRKSGISSPAEEILKPRKVKEDWKNEHFSKERRSLLESRIAKIEDRSCLCDSTESEKQRISSK